MISLKGKLILKQNIYFSKVFDGTVCLRVKYNTARQHVS